MKLTSLLSQLGRVHIVSSAKRLVVRPFCGKLVLQSRELVFEACDGLFRLLFVLLELQFRGFLRCMFTSRVHFELAQTLELFR